MRDVGLRSDERLQFLLVEMNAMRQHNVLISDSERIEISYIAHAGFALNHLAFTLVFRSVRVNHHPPFARQLCNFTEQPRVAADGKPWREEATKAPAGFAVPCVD